jgi:hypothetical protein
MIQIHFKGCRLPIEIINVILYYLGDNFVEKFFLTDELPRLVTYTYRTNIFSYNRTVKKLMDRGEHLRVIQMEMTDINRSGTTTLGNKCDF